MALAAVMAQSWPTCLGALRRRAAFCLLRGLLVISLESADVAMAELVQELCTDGDDRSAGQVLYAAWQVTAPSAGRGRANSLPRTPRALLAWSRPEPAVTRPPMPWLGAVAVAQVMLDWGEPLATLLVVLCFTCHLRPAEELYFQVADVVAPLFPISPCIALNLHPEERGQTSRLFIGEALLIAVELATSQRIFSFPMVSFAARFRAA